MLFCDADLARRIERAECDLLEAACHNAARRLDGVYSAAVAGGRAACTEAGSPLNKVAGVGFAGPVDEDTWVALEDAHAARGIAVQVEVASLAGPAVGQWLTRRGYELVGVENVLGCRLGGRAPAAAMVDVQVLDAEDPDAWLDIMVRGFLAPDDVGVPSHESFGREVLQRTMRDFTNAPGVVRYMARRRGESAGGGAMRVSGDVALLCGAATLPVHRRSGVQTALLSHRLADAAGRGATIATVTTQPGSKSQQNVQKQGFQLLYTRNVFRRET